MLNKLGLFVLVLCLAACSERPARTEPCPPVMARAILTETEEVRTYLKSANINATEDALGFFYTIKAAGTGAKPSACDKVKVNYEGTLTNGTRFDGAQGVEFDLGSLIPGWQEGIPKIAPGGGITLYLPPSLASGDEATGEIPAHSILVFNIDLLEVE